MDPVQDDLARSLSNRSRPAVATEGEKGPGPERDVVVGTGASATDLEKGSQQEGSQTDVPGESKDPFLVQFEDGDSQNPQKWSMRRKWALVAFLSWITLLT